MSWEEFALETTKLLRVRVFSTPRLCAFSSARWFHTELILGIPPFSVKHAIFLPRKYSPFREKFRRRNQSTRRGVCGFNSGAGEPLWGECPLRYFFVVCNNFHAAAAASLRVRLEVLGYLTYFAFSRCRFADSELRVFSGELLVYLPTLCYCNC